MTIMAKRKRGRPPRPPGTEPQRGRPVRIKPALDAQVQKLADRNASTVPIEVNRLVREGLVREGLWPPGAES